jgi:hypothetical protein
LVVLVGESPARQKEAENGEEVSWVMGSPQVTLKEVGLERMDVMAAWERMRMGDGGGLERGTVQEYLESVPKRAWILWFSEGMTSGKCA